MIVHVCSEDCISVICAGRVKCVSTFLFLIFEETFAIIFLSFLIQFLITNLLIQNHKANWRDSTGTEEKTQ